MITEVYHTAIIVSSEAYLKFYKHLGFTEIVRNEREHDLIVLTDEYGIKLEAFVDGKQPIREILEQVGLRHFSLKVDSIEETVEDLIFPQTLIQTGWVGQRYMFIYDPDGNVVELREEEKI